MPMEGVEIMSESGQRADNVRKEDAIHARTGSDRRVSKTRAMLLASFDRLLLAHGYEAVSVRELVKDADVGRSTFYEHFESKHDLLEHSVRRLLLVLAAAAATREPSDALTDALTHMCAQRAVAIALLRGSARAVMIRVLASELERHLAGLARRSNTAPIAPLPFLAESLAHAQLGTVDAWLSNDNRCDPQTAARVLHATTRAGIAATCGRPAPRP